jgi:methylmalonyl-CoA mutase cobalamin-binding subunit
MRRLAAELTASGHRVGADTVARLLREQGFGLQANAKTLKAASIPTAMASSPTSTTRLVSTWPPVTR